MAAPKPYLQPVEPVQPARPKCEFAICELHGRYLRDTGDGVVLPCKDCERDKKAGLTPDEARERADEAREKCLDECGLMGRYRNATLDNFRASTAAQRAVLLACRTFAESATFDSATGLLLLGPPGTGKTHLLAGMARHMAIERRMSVLLTTPRAIVRRLRACWVKGAKETEEGVIADLSLDVDVLLLDELGMGFGSDAELVQVFEVIDARHVWQMPVVAASNLNFPQLKAAIGDRNLDRLREGAKVLACNWPSHRGPA